MNRAQAVLEVGEALVAAAEAAVCDQMYTCDRHVDTYHSLEYGVGGVKVSCIRTGDHSNIDHYAIAY
jgi:hypothetical protein